MPAMEPAAFFPDGYTLFIDLDFAELRASGWLAALRKEGLAGHVDALLGKAGIGPDDLHRITLAGSSSDWSRLGAVLQGSAALTAQKLADRFTRGKPSRVETAGEVEILVPPRSGAAGASPAVASPAAGQVVLGPVELLRAALTGRDDGVPSEFLVACLPAGKATLLVATSQEEALADISRLLAAGNGLDLAGAAVSLRLAPELIIEVRVRVLEEASATALMRRMKARLDQLRGDLETGGWTEAARLVGRAELSRHGAMVVATVAGGEEGSLATSGPLLREIARALGPAPGAAAPVR
jgi:hypothetical protein